VILALTVAWIGLLGYGAVALTELAFGYYQPVGKTSSALAVKTTAPEGRHNIQATNIIDGSQATIIPCKTPRMAAIVGAPKSTTRIGREIPTAYFTPSTEVRLNQTAHWALCPNHTNVFRRS
jgi:hypothetical protein